MCILTLCALPNLTNDIYFAASHGAIDVSLVSWSWSVSETWEIPMGNSSNVLESFHGKIPMEKFPIDRVDSCGENSEVQLHGDPKHKKGTSSRRPISWGQSWPQKAEMRIWLVVKPPLWKIWKSVGMISNPILMGKFKKWQPNHQPGIFLKRERCESLRRTWTSRLFSPWDAKRRHTRDGEPERVALVPSILRGKSSNRV